MKAYVYMRVSTEEQAEKGYSMQAQRSEAERRAYELGCRIEDISYFSEEGISGSILERPQLMTALERLKREKDEVKYFICYDSSRLSRNASHQLILIDEIKRCGAQLIFLKNNYQDNAEGRFQLTVMAAVDEYERARLKLRTEMGKRAKASQHKLTHNPGLYGYRFDPVHDKLLINEEHANILKHIFYLLTEQHKGPVQIAEELNQSGIDSPRLKKWTRNTVRRILSNPSYLGTLYIRRYDTRDCHLNRFRKKGEKIKVKERPKDQWVPVEIPQIIEKETWEKAQEYLKSAGRTAGRRASERYLLASLLFCGMCGNPAKGKSVVKKGRVYRYYVCTGKYGSKSEKCPSGLLNAARTEDAVWNYVCKRILDYMKGSAEISILLKEYITMMQKNIANLKLKKEKANSERDRITLMFQKGFIDEDEMCQRLAENKRRLDAYSARLYEIQKSVDGKLDTIRKEWRKEKLPYIIKELLDNTSFTEKEQLINILINEIKAADNIITITEKP